MDGLTNGVSYSFDVAARNRTGTGLGSGPSETVIPWPSSRWKPAAQAPLSWMVRRLFVAGDEMFSRAYAHYLAAPFDPEGLPWGQIGPGYQGENSGDVLPVSEAAVPRTRSDGAVCIYYVGGSTWSG